MSMTCYFTKTVETITSKSLFAITSEWEDCVLTNGVFMTQIADGTAFVHIWIRVNFNIQVKAWQMTWNMFGNNFVWNAVPLATWCFHSNRIMTSMFPFNLNFFFVLRFKCNTTPFNQSLLCKRWNCENGRNASAKAVPLHYYL